MLQCILGRIVILGFNLNNAKCYAGIVIATIALGAGELTAMAWLAPAQAAGRADQANNSTGNIQLHVEKQASIRVKVAQDMVIQSWADDNSNMVWVGDVYLNSSRASGYDVTAIGGGKKGEFVLTGNGEQIPVKVAWNDSKSARTPNQPVSLRPGIPAKISPDKRIDRSGSASCQRGLQCNQAQLIVRIPRDASPSLEGSNLSQSLTLVIAMN